MAAKKALKKKPAKIAKKPAVAAKKMATVKDAYTKSQILNFVSERTELKRNDVKLVIESLGELIEAHVKPRSAGSFTLPGLLKIKVVNKPATKARKGINPFTGEPTTFKAKPARNVLKIRPLKKLKDMV